MVETQEYFAAEFVNPTTLTDSPPATPEWNYAPEPLYIPDYVYEQQLDESSPSTPESLPDLFEGDQRTFDFRYHSSD